MAMYKFRDYTIKNLGYHQPDHHVIWEAYDADGGVVAHGKTLRECELVLTEQDAVRKRTGHWGFIKYDCAACSVCGETLCVHFDCTSEALEHWDEIYPYCPYCGAKMEYVEPRVRSSSK